jgi:hypothetical protein
MPLSPETMLMLRQGTALPPGGMGNAAPTAGAVPGQPGDPSGPPGGGGPNPAMLEGILGKLMSQSGQADKQYPTKQIDNMKRLAAVMIAHLDQSHPEVARHMASAWRSLDMAMKAAETAGKQNGAAGPPINFSGAQQADTGALPVSPSGPM